MWIVRLALRRPYTFVVAALLAAITGILVILVMPTDIFPEIDIPVISVAFNYTGMSPDDMEQRIVGPFEQFLTITVNDIEHFDSQCLYGIGILKIYFYPGAKIEEAEAQVTSIAQTAIRNMPPGSQPPLIMRYSASNVPIMQLSIASDTLPEQTLFDQAVKILRIKLSTVKGVEIPYPYGGKQRVPIVDLDLEKLYAWGLSPMDVSTALNNQNLILPAGTAKIGKQEMEVRLNASTGTIAELNDMPIKTVKGVTVYLKDVAQVRDGFMVQTNIAHVNGKRGMVLSIMKSGGQSTLTVAEKIRKAVPTILPSMDPGIRAKFLFDQSIFVRASVEGVVKEAGIAALLTALMILIFLGSWRSTLVVVISIPLSVLVSIIILFCLGHTLNVMTLGGMALAVGILVDDATVEIENIHRNLLQGKRLVKAILDGASQIAVPAFVSTLAICIVFVPVVFIAGAAKYLFTPLAMAVVFAMLTSYLLSRTLVPTMVHYLLAAEVDRYGGKLDESDPHALRARQRMERHRHPLRIVLIVLIAAAAGLLVVLAFPMTRLLVMGWVKQNWHWLAEAALWLVFAATIVSLIARYDLVWRFHDLFNAGFERMRRGYGALLAWALEHRLMCVGAFATIVIGSCYLFHLIGQDFFPTVDAGQIRLHVRCPAGTRIEETENYFARVEDAIRRDIPPQEIATLIDNMGIPNSSINLTLSDGSQMSPADGEILIRLADEHKKSTADYIERIRRDVNQQFPDGTFFFSPPDIITQVLNFGLPAPIDIQINGPGRNQQKNYEIAREIVREVSKIRGVVDPHLAQVPHTPDLRVNVDRTLASMVGVSQYQVASDMLIALSSSNQVAPNYWLDPSNGFNYNVLVQAPQYRLDSYNALQNMPVQPVSDNSGHAPPAELLGNLGPIVHGWSATNITHTNASPTFDVQMGVQGKDLGSVASEVRAVVDKFNKRLEDMGSHVVLHGQVESMRDSFTGLGYGLIFAVLLVYLLMVINFQSWIDPLIILMALPGAAAGILWMLWATHTTINVPALMGAIMSIGVATSNSILMITFANDQRKAGFNAHAAALSAGMTRLRPVIMTALAMIIGMLPMSLGLGEGGEENAPLGRAVIGGLAAATLATLFFVPIVYSALRKKAPVTQVEEELR